MKILAIGNSYSQDATRYLREIAKSAGEKVKVVNLYIGGCPLSRHYANILEKAEVYELQIDGETVYKPVSIQAALVSDVWDVITIQQASYDSPYFERYEPYLNLITDTVKLYAPTAKIYVHQTWAYEDGSTNLQNTEFTTREEMFARTKDAYTKMFNYVKADGLIPSGDLVDELIKKGVSKPYRDGFHLSLGVSRYAAALLWFAVLLGGNIDAVTFNNFDEPVSLEEIKLVKDTIKQILNVK